MSVILTKSDDFYAVHGGACCACQKRVQFPFVHWEQILLCASCCARIRRGLGADMIHAAAVAELRQLYPDATLERRSAEPDKIARLFPKYAAAGK